MAESSSASTSGCPVQHDKSPKESCPVKNLSPKTTPGNDDETSGYNARANDLVFGQQRQKDQSVMLSTERSISTIPKGEYTPHHQPEQTEKWVYPSEQQYFNAMKRKGWNPQEADVPVILAIHNAVNEKGWTQIKQWEALRGCMNPKLVSFMGRPQEMSPKARILNLIG